MPSPKQSNQCPPGEVSPFRVLRVSDADHWQSIAIHQADAQIAVELRISPIELITIFEVACSLPLAEPVQRLTLDVHAQR